MVWENIEETKKHTTLFIRSSQFVLSAIFIFSNKVLGAFFFLREIFSEQNFLID